MADTDIQWTEKVWNCLRGCSRVSPGCGGAAHVGGCYAEKMAARFSGPGMPYEGLVTIGKQGARWTGVVRLVPKKLDEPLRWKKPRRIFVNSMSDLFHESLSNETIAAIFGVMGAAPQHTFQVLTKRAKRMREWFVWVASQKTGLGTITHSPAIICAAAAQDAMPGWRWTVQHPRVWPLPGVWMGVSVEDQKRADERIPDLLTTPAAVRWISLEPQLEDVDLWAYLKTPQRDRSLAEMRAPSMPGLGWIVQGGESGHGARGFNPTWAKLTQEQCRKAGVAYFFKQFGSNAIDFSGTKFKDSHGGDPSEWPAEFNVRQYPTPEVAP
jgi:protein gp37